ncbi:hypothetical protein ACFL0T_03000 [Candidatus Omnitrophota bacterium]
MIAKKKIYCGILLLLLALITFAQLLTLNSEIATMGFTIQHDEKLILPDARSFYLGGNHDVKDYTQPVSAAFGILSPRIVELGFRIFGFNNYGLRLPFVIFSTISTLLFILIMMRLCPNIVGFLISLLQLLNYRYFTLTRYAVSEDILILIILALIWFYIAKRDFLIRHINKAAFLAGALVLVKLNFPFYLFILLGSLAIIERFSVRNIIKLIIYSIVSVIFFYAIQALILSSMGLLEAHLKNTMLGLVVYGGKEMTHFATQTYTKPIAFLEVMPRYFELMRAWYLQGYVNTAIFFSHTKVIEANMVIGNLIFIATSVGILLLLLKKKDLKTTCGFGIFLICSLFISSRLLFYIKRILPFFPVTCIFFGSLYSEGLRSVQSQKVKEVVKYAAAAFLLLLLITQVANQSKFLKALGPHIKSNRVEENSRAIDKVLPPDSTVYMHCYGLRFFWQTKNRIISGDDQLLNNQMIIDKALADKGKYLLLDPRGGEVKLKSGYGLKLLGRYMTDMASAGYRINHQLLEIRKK